LYYCKRNLAVYSPFKDIHNLADLKQQISQGLYYLCSTSPKCHCAATPLMYQLMTSVQGSIMLTYYVYVPDIIN